MSGAQRAKTGAGGEPTARCVVLCTPADPPPREILDGLARRGAEALLLHNPVEVMVELAQRRCGALIVESVPNDHRLTPLLDAVRRYYPATPCWFYRSASNGHRSRLERIDLAETASRDTATDATGPMEAAPTQPEPPQGVQPDADPWGDEAGDDDETDQPARVSEPLVSAEELDMLMGPVLGQLWEKSSDDEPDPER